MICSFKKALRPEIGGSVMFVPSIRTRVPKARPGREFERGWPPLVRGVRGVSPGKIWISRVSEKQSEALLGLSQTILKENRPFFLYFHMTYFTPIHSKTEYKFSIF